MSKTVVKTTPSKDAESESRSVMINATPATRNYIKHRRRIIYIHDGVDGSQHSERRGEKIVWRARVQDNGMNKHLGTFSTKSEASSTVSVESGATFEGSSTKGCRALQTCI